MTFDITNLIAAVGVGTIEPPTEFNIPTAGADPTGFVAGLIRNGIQLLLIVGFIMFFIWTIFAGFRFVTSGGDPKSVSSAWSQIYWGLIGMLVILGSYAIVRLVEIFFHVNIVTGGLQLPNI